MFSDEVIKEINHIPCLKIAKSYVDVDSGLFFLKGEIKFPTRKCQLLDAKLVWSHTIPPTQSDSNPYLPYHAPNPTRIQDIHPRKSSPQLFECLKIFFFSFLFWNLFQLLGCFNRFQLIRTEIEEENQGDKG